MSRPPPQRTAKRARKTKLKGEATKATPSRFAPAAFLSGSALSVQQLCDELAERVAERFSDLTGTSWERVGTSVVEQLRASGHDLRSFDEARGLQEWQATWHLPRGTFSLFLAFRAPNQVEVTWKTDEATFSARAAAG